ncbi:MAG: recombinase family protein [Pirellulaceae bacterium]
MPTQSGKARWDRATIRSILINPAYAGLILKGFASRTNGRI